MSLIDYLASRWFLLFASIVLGAGFGLLNEVFRLSSFSFRGMSIDMQLVVYGASALVVTLAVLVTGYSRRAVKTSQYEKLNSLDIDSMFDFDEIESDGVLAQERNSAIQRQLDAIAPSLAAVKRQRLAQLPERETVSEVAGHYSREPYRHMLSLRIPARD